MSYKRNQSRYSIKNIRNKREAIQYEYAKKFIIPEDIKLVYKLMDKSKVNESFADAQHKFNTKLGNYLDKINTGNKEISRNYNKFMI